MILLISCLFAIAASVSADGLGLGGGLVYAPRHASVDYYTYPKYAFEYSVNDPHTGDNKAQWEKRDGDVVKGAYSLVEPDGSIRVVEYWADDKSGFNAVVKRIGSKLHPVSVPASIYKAPIPLLGHGSAVAPLTVGPVAKLGNLANAPLISGPIYAGPLSPANLLKTTIPYGSLESLAPIVKTPIVPISKPVTPILPIIKEAPYADPGLLGAGIHGPIYKSGPIYAGQGPILKSGLEYPILPSPVLKAGSEYNELLPILKSGPVYKDLLSPVLKSGPVYANLPGPILKSEPVYKELLSPVLKSGPVYANLQGPILKSEPVYKELLSPVLKSEPVYKDLLSPVLRSEPVYKELLSPVIKSGPVYPYLPSPNLKSGSIYSDLPSPILKSGPILSSYLEKPIALPLPLSKVPSGLENGYLNGYENGYIKGHESGYLKGYGPEIVNPWAKVIKV